MASAELGAGWQAELLDKHVTVRKKNIMAKSLFFMRKASLYYSPNATNFIEKGRSPLFGVA